MVRPAFYSAVVRWIVGDIHGCAAELDTLLATVGFDTACDELWSVGDIINRGPDSLAAARLWRDVGGRAVVGNHERYACGVAAGTRPRTRDTLDALFAASDGAELLARLGGLPVLARLGAGDVGRDVWLVHAGLDPRWTDLPGVAARTRSHAHDDDALASTDVVFATEVRCCTAAGVLGPVDDATGNCRAPCHPWDQFYGGPVLVVHGHWARRGHYRGPYTLGLDSGCVYGGCLTAWCQDEDRVVQVPARRR
jgi:bis(5'-nucleosyl)-tetraphosphatase (symmetrical)